MKGEYMAVYNHNTVMLLYSHGRFGVIQSVLMKKKSLTYDNKSFQI